MTFEEYISKNYQNLCEIAGRVFRHSQLQSEEIINEMFVDIKMNKREINPTEHDFDCYCKRWIQSRKKWTGGNIINDLKIDDRYKVQIEMYSYKLEGDKLNMNSDRRKDLIRVGFTSDQSEMIERCVEVSQRLPLYQKRLFELYYLEGMSMGKIANSCNLPKTSIQRDIQKLNKIIKSKI
jgi:RNA polymerase sigma factor (sigma-70 family)